jgi:hypothetical protein
MSILPITVLLGAAAALVLVETRKGKVDSPTAAPATSSLPVLDSSLPARNALAVVVALQKETNPRNLSAFAATLEPEFPMASSALRTRAAVLSSSAK